MYSKIAVFEHLCDSGRRKQTSQSAQQPGFQLGKERGIGKDRQTSAVDMRYISTATNRDFAGSGLLYAVPVPGLMLHFWHFVYRRQQTHA